MNQSRSNLSMIIDFVFTVILTYTTCSILFSKLLKFNGNIQKIISVCIAFIVTLAIFKGLQANLKTQKLKQKELLLCKQTLSYLENASLKDTVVFFKNMLEKNHKTEIKNGYLILDDDTCLMFNFYSPSTTKFELANMLNTKFSHNISKIIIFCIDFDILCYSFAENLRYQILLYNQQDLFLLLKKYSFYKEFKIKEKQKTQLKELIKNANGFKLFLCGILIYSMQIFSKTLALYYTIFACLCFSLCVANIVLKNKIQPIKQNNKPQL